MYSAAFLHGIGGGVDKKLMKKPIEKIREGMAEIAVKAEELKMMMSEAGMLEKKNEAVVRCETGECMECGEVKGHANYCVKGE